MMPILGLMVGRTIITMIMSNELG